MSRFLRRIRLQNLLSFDDCNVELQDLNVLIGPNGAGKSNLIESIGLLRSLLYDYPAYLKQGGGLAAWTWKGQKGQSARVWSVIQGAAGLLVHEFQVEDSIKWERLQDGETKEHVFKRDGDSLDIPGREPQPFHHRESVLRRRGIPDERRLISETGYGIESIRIYREFRTGKNESLRHGSSGQGSESGHLDEGGQNLALILHEFDAKDKLDQVGSLLSEVNQSYKKVKPRFVNGAWLVQLEEEGLLDPVMSQRISDGTLKFLCLAALLLDPQPPPLICIEEPEVGLHPDAMRVIARLLREASERTQIIITTHSVDLVNEFTAVPEAVMVTEKDANHATRFTRLDREKLQSWLERYQLGELWQKGELGGNRW